MAKHTPGPWRADNKLVLDATGNVLARVETDSFSLNLSERFADARLMAAAPELLEALKQCVALLDSVAFVADEGDKDAIQERAERAIAKADDKS